MKALYGYVRYDWLKELKQALSEYGLKLKKSDEAKTGYLYLVLDNQDRVVAKVI